MAIPLGLVLVGTKSRTLLSLIVFGSAVFLLVVLLSGLIVLSEPLHKFNKFNQIGNTELNALIKTPDDQINGVSDLVEKFKTGLTNIKTALF